MAPEITVRLSGASHLVGFSGFALQEVRRARPERPGARILSGPFHRQPQPGVPLAIRLKPSTRALYFRARAYEPVRDVVAALVPEAGRVVTIPLRPPPVSAGALVRLARLFQRAEWVEAVSYRHSFPHEYSRRSAWANDEDFVFAATMIAKHSYRAWFRGSTSAGWWQQLDLAIEGTPFTFWTGFPRPHLHHWINRRALVDRPPVPQRVPAQALCVEGARLLGVTDPRELAALLFPEGP